MSKLYHPLLALIASAASNELAKYVEYYRKNENEAFVQTDKFDFPLITEVPDGEMGYFWCSVGDYCNFILINVII